MKIVPRVALIGQCYVESVLQPYLILREDKDVAFFSFVRSTQGVGLMFGNEELKALGRLLLDDTVAEEFYYYWNDAVNSTGYSSKLLLMFSAIEALVKVRKGHQKGRKDFGKLEQILGPDLKKEIWGEMGKSKSALRHKLVHGEYFSPDDSGKNYLELIHKKIVEYFNGVIFQEQLIHENVVHPQRHPFGNREGWRGFIKAMDRSELNLKDVLAEFEEKDLGGLERYSLEDGAIWTDNYQAGS